MKHKSYQLALIVIIGYLPYWIENSLRLGTVLNINFYFLSKLWHKVDAQLILAEVNQTEFHAEGMPHGNTQGTHHHDRQQRQ